MSPVLWVPAALLVIAAVVDLRRREIPDAIPLLLLAWGIVTRLSGLQEPDWWALLGGLVLGLVLGALLFWLGAFGGGDAKLLGGLGAILGPVALLIVMIYIAAVGGVFALVALIRRRRDLAYGPAIALGFIIAILI
ncbi:MAG: prepilin peptidase [Planctomycetota bacterium]|jgi:Flp pilus assembly protein protease CpaA